MASKSNSHWSAGAPRMRVCYTSIISTAIDSIERGEMASAAAWAREQKAGRN